MQPFVHLRSVGRFRFLAVVDFDEYLIPHRSKNLASYLTEMSNHGPQVGSFVFRNVFFYLYWENETTVTSESSEGGKNFLVTQSKIRRTAVPSK